MQESAARAVLNACPDTTFCLALQQESSALKDCVVHFVNGATKDRPKAALEAMVHRLGGKVISLSLIQVWHGLF